MPPRRIELPPDATTALLQAVIDPGEIQTYVVQVDLGQPLWIAVDSAGSEVHFGLRTAGGTSIIDGIGSALRRPTGRTLWMT